MTKKIVYIDNFLSSHGRTPVTGEAMVKLFTNEGFEVVYASRINNKFIRLIDMLKTIYRHRKKSTVLIATYSTSAFYFAWICGTLCKKLNIPYIPCLHGGNLPQRIKQSYSKSRQFFGNAVVNVAVSGYLEKSIKANHWPCVVIPNYITLADYPFYKKETCKPKLLWVRSFHKIYNPQLAINVLHELLKTHHEATLTMVGPDKDGSTQECLQLAATLNITSHINFTGLLSKTEWIKLAVSHDIFINTSNFDNLPVSIIEAMALGFPVVSTNAGGIPFLIEDGIDGLLVENNNLERMLNAIKTILSDNHLAKELSENARSTACSFDYPNVADKWKKLLG